MSDAPELKPCPFCGDPAELETDNDHHGEWFNLGCQNHWGHLDPDDACVGGRLFYTEDLSHMGAAIAEWNSRADGTNALVAAAYAAAVDACGDYPRVAPDRDRWEPYDEQIEYSQECIRALTPADAQAALDALVEARVAEKVREALTEAASLDWRNMFLAIIDRMRKAGESKEMAGRWAGCEFSKAILDLRDQKEPKG